MWQDLIFSHNTHEDHQKRIDLIKKVRSELKMTIAIMLDTKGPEYRIKTFKNQKITLNDGDKFTFTTEDIVNNKKLKENTAGSINSRINRIKEEYTIEHEYIKDGCAELLSDFTYTAEDAKNGSIPNVRITISGSYLKSLRFKIALILKKSSGNKRRALPVAEEARRLLRSGRKKQARHANAQIFSGYRKPGTLFKNPCSKRARIFLRCFAAGRRTSPCRCFYDVP